MNGFRLARRICHDVFVDKFENQAMSAAFAPRSSGTAELTQASSVSSSASPSSWLQCCCIHHHADAALNLLLMVGLLHVFSSMILFKSFCQSDGCRDQCIRKHSPVFMLVHAALATSCSDTVTCEPFKDNLSSMPLWMQASQIC